MNIALGGKGGIINDDVREKMRQSHLGLKHSEETKRRMSQNSTGKNNPFFGKKHQGDPKRFGHQKNCRAIEIDGVRYDSCLQAAKALNLSPASITKRLKDGRAKYVNLNG